MLLFSLQEHIKSNANSKYSLQIPYNLLLAVHKYYINFSILFTLYIVKTGLVECKPNDTNINIDILKEKILHYNRHANIPYHLQLSEDNLNIILKNYKLFYYSFSYSSSYYYIKINPEHLFTISLNVSDDIKNCIDCIIINSFYKIHLYGSLEFIYQRPLNFNEPIYIYDSVDADLSDYKSFDILVGTFEMNNDTNSYITQINIGIYLQYISKNFPHYCMSDLEIVNNLIYNTNTLSYHLFFQRPLFDGNTDLKDDYKFMDISKMFVNDFKVNKKK